jgi:DNA-binding response OmpR family regulator
MTHRKRLSILVIEDDAEACELLGSLLSVRYPEASVTCAGDGTTGKALIRELNPDIIISDISMPDMDGIRMLSEVRTSISEAWIIVVTAHSDRRILAELSTAGIKAELITKPLDFRCLLASVDGFLETTSQSAGTPAI